MKKVFIVTMAISFTLAALVAVSSGTQKGMTLPKDWPTYRHIGSLIVTDKDHPLHGIHHFYMNKKGLAAFEKGGNYPDGTVIVDSVYEIVDNGGILNEGKLAFFPVMKKNSKMKETGGWEWYAFSADGKMLDKDPKKDCLGCHEDAKDRDYVLSKPLQGM
ncbi:MAG: cytochrome P460 family protein [Nitrospirota bacterium]